MSLEQRMPSAVGKTCIAAVLSLCTWAAQIATAHAEADSFGLGTGRDGALSITSANQTINAYAAVTANASVGATTVAVDTVAGFSAGQLVMLWQTSGLTTAQAPRGSQTTIDLTNSGVGHYEFARIESIDAAGPALILTLPTINPYVLGTAQVVSVPEYTTVTIDAAGSLVPGQLWNGAKGGIVAFLASGAVVNEGVISANAAGFRGGTLINHGALNNCAAATMGLPDDGTPATGYARKGEGLVPGAYDPATGGRTNVANGGGGGVCHNSGGGGGAHAGRGGGGGRTWAGDGGGRDLGGYGGAALSYDPRSYAAFGGGGGSGDENNNVGTPGGVGGGVVLIRAAALSGAGFIRANGSKPLHNNGPAVNDAAGGGGAGGAVILRIAGDLACMGIEANGGAGGDVQFGTVATNDAHGVGGGGGGGRVFIEAGSNACAIKADAGVAGQWNATQNWGATPATGDDATSIGVVTIVGTAFAASPCSAANLAAGVCGGCIVNAECPGGATPVCDLTTNSCRGCAASFGGGVGACPNIVAPVCIVAGPLVGSCGECNDNTDCGANINGTVCDTNKNTCGTCSATNANGCSGTTAFCDTSLVHNACAGCNGDFGGAATRSCGSALAACVTTGADAGVCVECLANNHCVGNTNGAVCDGGKRLCGACNASELGACGGGTPTCDVLGARDVCAACNGNFASNTTLACTSALLPLCAGSGALAGGCVQCLSASDCSGSTPFCDASVGACAACNGDFGSGAVRACGMVEPFCAASGCSNVCVADTQCGAGNWCNSGACQAKVANGQPTPGGSCQPTVANRACVSGVCDAVDGLCGLPTGNPSCSATAQCRSGVCVASGANMGTCLGCNTDNDCAGATPACNPTTNLCVACTAGNVAACVGASPLCDFAASTCVACNGDAGSAATRQCGAAQPLCRTDGACGVCTGNTDCTVGVHLGPVCNTSSGACGTGCSVDANCPPNQYCDNPAGSGFTGSCTPKLANMAPFPTGQPFAGMCNPTAAARVCASGVCDDADDKCGLPNGGTCATAAVCRSAVCGLGGLCGLPNGDSCMNNNVCRAGVCAPDGSCGLANSEACTNNAQCRSNVCGQSGKCGLDNGETCAAATACSSGVCFADGKCGLPEGQACAATSSCRSSMCTNSVCVGTADAGADRDGGASLDGGDSDGALPASGGSMGEDGSTGAGGAAGASGAGGAGGVIVADAGTGNGDETLRVGGGGCACQVGQSPSPMPFVWTIGLALWLRRRRRR